MSLLNWYQGQGLSFWEYADSLVWLKYNGLLDVTLGQFPVLASLCPGQHGALLLELFDSSGL